MKFFSKSEYLELAVKHLGTFCVYVNTDYLQDDDNIDIIQPALDAAIAGTGANRQYRGNLLVALWQSGLLSFDDETEARRFFKIFNKIPLYASSVYVMLISPTDGILDTNT